MRLFRVHYTAALALLLNACSSEDGSESGGNGGGGRLSPSAIAELDELGVNDYRGKAVITSEVNSNGAVRVTFDPSSGPVCYLGAEFAAFYLDRGSDKTMILLDGGGACWSDLCAASETADATIATAGPASEDPSNYFHDWNLVYAPFCDGSVFSGDNDYQNGTTLWRFHGRQNLAAALDLAAEHFGDSKQVLIGGFSAGGYGCLPGMIATRLVYPDADIFVMDDSGPGIQNPAQTTQIQHRIDEWGYATLIPPSCTECDGGHGQLTALFSWMLKNDRTMKISLLSYFEDGVIGTTFNGLDGAAYKELLVSETNKVQAAYPDRFKRFMLPGTSHVVSGGWPSLTADGVTVASWVTAMATGDDTVWQDILATGP
jgi:hypothetical protein